MVKSKRAFTLIESLLSMGIIIIVSFCILPVLTKQKSRTIDTVTLRGQYGCWVDPTTNTLKEWYFNERTPRTPTPRDVQECRLVLDTRPANFYILAAGAGSKYLPGQVKSVYTPALSDHLEIELGRYDDPNDSSYVNTTTTVSTGASAEVIAAGHDSNLNIDSIQLNGLVPENIKSCKLVKSEACTSTCCPRSCEVFKKTDLQHGTYHYIVRINGCETFDQFGNQDAKVFELSSLQYFGLSGEQNLKQFSASNIQVVNDVYSSPNEFYWKSSDDAYRFNFEFYDSSFALSDMLLGFYNNKQHNYNDEKSKMSDILDTISLRRQSELIKKLSELNPGAPQKSDGSKGGDGAVLILW